MRRCWSRGSHSRSAPRPTLAALERLEGSTARKFEDLLHATPGYAELGMSRLSVLPPVFAYLTQLAVATKELLALIEGLEAFRGQQALSPETFDLNKFLRCFSHRLKHLLPGSIVVDLDLRAAFPQVNADPCRSQQVLMYLVDNASEAMPRGARLTIASGDTSVDDVHLCQRPNAMVGTHKPLRNGLGRSRTWELSDSIMRIHTYPARQAKALQPDPIRWR
jgi:signal transduction histidine kinase